MSGNRQPDDMYRLYISDGGTRFYLRDIIVHEKTDHYLFDVDRRWAMTFRRRETAMKYRNRMIAAKYHPQIDPEQARF